MNQQSRNVINRAREQRAPAVPLERPGGSTSEFKLILFVIIANLVMWGVDVATEDFNMAIPSAVSTLLAVGYKVSRTLVKLKGGDLARGDEYSEKLLGLLDMANEEIQEWRRQGANPNSPVQPPLRATPLDDPIRPLEDLPPWPSSVAPQPQSAQLHSLRDGQTIPPPEISQI